MKTFQTSILIVLFGLVGCGKSALKTKSNTLSAATPTTTNTSNTTSQNTQTQTQSNDLLLNLTTCSNFNVLTSVSNPNPRVSENVDILFKLQPCTNGLFTYIFEDGTQSTAFTDSISRSKSFTTVGLNYLSFFVSVKNASGLIIQRKEFTVQFNVQPAAVVPTAPEVSIARMPVFVSSPNQPVVVKVSVSGTFTSLTLNGGVIQADVQYPVAPVSNGSDTYIAKVTAYNGTLERTVTQTFVMPRCTHTVANSTNVGATLTTNTSYSLSVTQLWVNSEFVPVPQGTNGVVLSRTLSYNPGSYTSNAVVKNAYGDSFSCSASYRQLHNPITLVLGSPVISSPTNGYSTSGKNRALHGGGHKMQYAEWQFQAATFSEEIHTGAVHSAMNECPANEVMVGLSSDTASSLPWRYVLCAPLKAGLETYEVRTQYVPWQVNSIGSCGTGQNGEALEILVGTSWQDVSTGPGPGFGTWGRLNLKCAKIRWATDL